MSLPFPRTIRVSRLVYLSLLTIASSAFGANNYQSVDFGSTNVGATSSSQTVTFTFTGLAAQPTFNVRYAQDFSVTNTSCDSGWNTCMVTATFTPTYSGLRQDAIVARDSGGNALSTAYLHGVGLSPQVTVGHGKISVRLPATSGQSYVTTDQVGNIYFADYAPFPSIKKLVTGSSTPQILVGRSFVANQFTFAENTPGTSIFLGSSTVPFIVDAAGNLFFYYPAGYRICKLDAVTGLVSTVAGGAAGVKVTFNDGDAATSLSSISANSFSLDVFGNLYLGRINEVDRIDLNNQTIYHVAGTGGYANTGDNGPAVNASLTERSMTVDWQGNLFLFDPNNGVREIVASSGVIKKIFGGTAYGPLVDGGLAANINFSNFSSMASDAQDNLYFGSFSGDAIWKIDIVSGILTRILGKYSGFTPADGIDSDLASFNGSYFTIDLAGNIYTATSFDGLLKIAATDGYVVFPNPQAGDTAAPQLVTLTNSGNQDLHLTSQAVSGPYQTATTTNNPCSFPGTLPAGARCTVLVTPSAAGSVASSSLTIADDGLNAASTHVFSLQIGYPQATLQSTTANFGAGTAVGGSGYGGVSLSNTGGKVPLTVSAATISGANAADFSLYSYFCSSVSPGYSCTLSLTFQPLAVGTRTATLTIVSNAAASPQVITLTGTGLPRPSLTVTPTTLKFGNQVVGQASRAQTIVITNSGIPDLQLASYTPYLYGPDFFVSADTCAYSSYFLRAGQSCSYSLQFKPTSAQPKTGNINISATGSGVYVYGNVSFSGTGVLKPSVRFVPIAPCRILDTRDPEGPFGGPSIAAQATRDLDVASSACGIPANAVAYSLNATVVPSGPLSWLTLWPTGQAQPLVSTLNSFDGRIKANAAVVPAGTNCHINLFATDKTNVILDTNGYFLQVMDDSALAFYSVPPCRVMDTRNPTGPLGAPLLAGRQEREIPVLTSGCGIPATAKAYSFNFTVIPKSPLDYLTVWPSGQTRPLVSTLNAPTATVVANAAIVPAGQAGDISLFATNDTEMIIDVNGYFATTGQGGLSLNVVIPCRVFDSRETPTHDAVNGPLSLSLANSCNLPAETQAIISNATVVPSGAMGYLSLWPSGQPQPTVSTLNAYDATVTSNLAIVPTGGGAINAFTAAQTHLILDVSAYFAP